MKNLNEKSAFEHFWEKTFSEAEMAPSDHVWDRIDASLSREETGKYRKRVFIYKLLAAASIAFALGIGAFSLNYYLNTPQSSALSTIQQPGFNTNANESINQEKSADPTTPNQETSKEYASTSDTPRQGEKNTTYVSDMSRKAEIQENSSLSQVKEPVHVPEDSQNSPQLVILPALSSIWINPADEPMDVLAFAPDHMYLIPIMPKGSSRKSQNSHETDFIAGLDFSTGLFDPNFGQNSQPAFSSNGFATMARAEQFNDQLASFNTVNKDFLAVRDNGKETSPEISYSYGANLGFMLSRRFLVQTGLSYRKSNSTTTSSAYIEEVSSGKRVPIVASYNYALEGLSVVNSMEETSLTNQFEFLSVPLRAGYLILDKRLNVTVLAGISSEFFLGNNISGGGDFLESISNVQGESSPYKNVYFNGSVGTMVGYTIAGQYNLTIEPGYRFAVNSFTKDEFYLNSYPSSFVLAFGVAYNFK